MLTAFSFEIGLLNLGFKMNVKSIKLYNKNLANLCFRVKLNIDVKINVKYFGSTARSVTITAQSLQYYAFCSKLVHDKQAKSFIDKNYLEGT